MYKHINVFILKYVFMDKINYPNKVNEKMYIYIFVFKKFI